MSFKPAPSELFFSRNDKTDPRIGELARATSALTQAPPNTRAIAITGYPDDEGIRLNGGRPGASEAPDRIRRFLYKMTPSVFSRSEVAIADIGNLDVKSADIAGRHDAAEARATEALQSGYRVLSFGGGHDYGFCDTTAFSKHCEKRGVRPLVLNFDAHMDVRPLDRGLTSGTPFFRLLEAHPQTDFAEIGIQAQCNSATHRKWAEDRGVRILNLEDLRASGESLAISVCKRLEDWLIRPRPAFLSIDIDGFSNAFAPGCSQSWATGFNVDEFLQLFQILTARLDVLGVGIYEVSPPLDQDDRTAKLAALLAHRFIYPL